MRGPGIAIVFAVLAGAGAAHAQRATERYIPLGQSPGVSGPRPVIRTIVAVEPSERRIDLEGPAGRASVRLEESTPVWIDRHAAGLPSETGSFADCQVGRMAEVAYADPEARQHAAWLKLRAEAPAP